MFGRLSVLLQAQIFREAIQFRRDNRHLDEEQFRIEAKEHFKELFAGIDPDNLRLILEFLEKIIPLLMQLLPLFIETPEYPE